MIVIKFTLILYLDTDILVAGMSPYNKHYAKTYLAMLQVDHTLRQLMIALMTHIIYIDHVRRNELYWAGDNPDELAFRETTYARDVGEVQGNTLMPLACSIKQVMTLRGISIDASALERMKEIQYAYPSSQYLGDMQAYIVFTSLHRLVSESRVFFNAVAKAGLLRRV